MHGRRTIADQSTCAGQAGGADSIAHEPVVADANEPGRKDVEQEAAEELVGIENHDPLGDRARGRVAITKAQPTKQLSEAAGETTNNGNQPPAPGRSRVKAWMVAGGWVA